MALMTKVRKMHLAVVHTAARGAALLVSPLADAEPRLQALDNLGRVRNAVVFQAKPQRRLVFRTNLIGGLHYAVHALCREAVVREVHLLDTPALPNEAGQGLSTLVIDLVLEEPQDSKPVALHAQIKDPLQP